MWTIGTKFGSWIEFSTLSPKHSITWISQMAYCREYTFWRTSVTVQILATFSFVYCTGKVCSSSYSVSNFYFLKVFPNGVTIAYFKHFASKLLYQRFVWLNEWLLLIQIKSISNNPFFLGERTQKDSNWYFCLLDFFLYHLFLQLNKPSNLSLNPFLKCLR